MWPRSLRWELLIATACLAYNLLWLGHVGLFDVDEAIFAEATREMVETGDLITPTYNYQVRWDKPPLIYWAMAAPLRYAGATAFAARFASALAGALLVLVVMLFGRSLWGPAAGRWAGVVFATSLHVFALSHMAVTDMTLTLLMACGWIALYQSAERQSPGWFLTAALALGAATLTKGPVALVLPGATWVAYLLWRRRFWRTLDATHCWWGVLLYALVVAPWCVAIYLRHGTAFFESFLGYHNLNRFASTQSGHGGPIYTFLLVALFGILPWSGFALAGIVRGWRERGGDDAGRAGFYLLLWIGFVLALFSASQTKLPNYIAPLYPAVALLAGREVAAAVRPRRGWWGLLWFLNLGGLVGIGAAMMSAGAWLPRIDELERELGSPLTVLGTGPVVAGAVMLMLAVLIAAAWAAHHYRVALVMLAGGGAASWLALWLGVVPVVYHYQQGTLRVMGVAAAHAVGPRGDVATLNIRAPSIAFTTERGFRDYVASPERPASMVILRQRFASPRPLLLVTRQRHEGLLRGVRSSYRWASRLGYVMLGNRPPPDDFRLPPSPWTERDMGAREER